MKRLLAFYGKSLRKGEGEKLARWFQDYVGEEQPEPFVGLTKTGPLVDHADLVKKTEAIGADTPVIIGGDGTIHRIIQTFQRTLSQYHTELLPGGTVNDLVRILEIPLEKGEVTDVILEGSVRKIDYGQVNSTAIISTLAAGISAGTAVWISQEKKQRHGSWVSIKKFFKLLLKKRKYHLGLETDEEHWRGESQLLTVTMSSSAGGFINFDNLVTPDNRKFRVTTVSSLDIFRFIFYLPRIMRGKFYTIPGIAYFTAKRMEIRAKEKSVGTWIGGGTTDGLPVELSVVSKGLAVCSPKKEGQTQKQQLVESWEESDGCIVA